MIRKHGNNRVNYIAKVLSLVFIILAANACVSCSHPMAYLCDTSDKYCCWIKITKTIDHGSFYEIQGSKVIKSKEPGKILTKKEWKYYIISFKRPAESIPAGAVRIKRGCYYKLKLLTMTQAIFGENAVPNDTDFNYCWGSTCVHAKNGFIYVSPNLCRNYCLPIKTISPSDILSE